MQGEYFDERTIACQAGSAPPYHPSLPAPPTCAVSALPTTSSKDGGRTPLRQQAFRVCLLLTKAKGIEFANNGLFKASSMIALQPHLPRTVAQKISRVFVPLSRLTPFHLPFQGSDDVKPNAQAWKECRRTSCSCFSRRHADRTLGPMLSTSALHNLSRSPQCTDMLSWRNFLKCFTSKSL